MLENYFSLRNQTLASYSQVKYVQDIFVSRDTSNTEVVRKKFMQVIIEIDQ